MSATKPLNSPGIVPLPDSATSRIQLTAYCIEMRRGVPLRDIDVFNIFSEVDSIALFLVFISCYGKGVSVFLKSQSPMEYAWGLRPYLLRIVEASVNVSKPMERSCEINSSAPWR